MAVAFKSVSSKNEENDNSGTTSVVNFPTNVEGDFLLAFINASNGTPNLNPAATHSPAAGWTELFDDSSSAATANGLYVAYRFAPAGGLTSETFTAGSSTGYHSFGVVYTGVNTTTPIDGNSTVNTGSGNVTCNAYTTTQDDVMVIRIFAGDDDVETFTSPGGHTERINALTANPGNGVASGWADTIQASAGSTGTAQFTRSTEEWVSRTFGLAPEPEGGSYDQDSFRGRNDDGSETAATWKAAANTNWEQLVDENFRVRFLVEELDDVEELNVQFQLQYNKNAAGWNDVNGSSSNVRSFASPNVTDAIDTTEQLSGPGVFVTPNDGFDEANGLAGGNDLDFSTTNNQEVELEYCCQVRSADTSPGDTIQLRVVKEADVELNTYTNTPVLTIKFPPDWVMSLSSNFANGDSTTEQLSASTGSFAAGEMLESSGEATNKTLNADSYTEYEFCIQAQGSATGQYEFRLIDETQSGEKMEIYTRKPKVTMA